MSRPPRPEPSPHPDRAGRRGASRQLVVLGALAGAIVSCAPDPSPFGEEPVPAPVLFAPGVISTEAREYGVAFSTDGREAYFTRRPRRGRPEILVSRWDLGAWSEPEPLPFAIESGEAPFLDRSGRLFFSARAPVASWFEHGAGHLWVASRSDEGWTEPVPLPGTVNELGPAGAWIAADDEDWDPSDVERTGPVLLEEGTLLYSAAVDPEWRSDLYVAYEVEGRFVDATPLSPRVNSQRDESNPAVSPDGRYLVFQAYRPDGLGEEDLYISERFEHGFSTPRPLPPPINSEDNDGYPAFTPDGRFFFFSSDRDGRNGAWSIYYVDVEALHPGPEPRLES